MNTLRSHKAVSIIVLLILSIVCADVFAAEAEEARPNRPSRSWRGRGIYGDWDVKMDYNGREYSSILSFTRNKEGKLAGSWISLWGMSELEDVKFAEGKLSFARTSTRRNGEKSTSKFEGTVKDGTITGTMKSSRGETKVTGKRPNRTPRAVGRWEMKMQMGERDINTTLVIEADKEGKLEGAWKSKRGEHTISDIKYERGKLTFKHQGKIEEHKWESSFEGNVRGDTLSGMFKSERGELKAEGKRIGGAAIGRWDLEIASERGSRKQRLKINPDMSGMYGSIPIKKVMLDADKISFTAVMSFGERKFEMNFAGTIKEAKLDGELKTSRGTQKITGEKIVRTMRRRRSSS